MKPIFYPNEYRTAAFCASYTRLLRWLRGFSPPLIYDPDILTIPWRFSGINCLQQTFGSGSFTIVLPFFCLVNTVFFSHYLQSVYIYPTIAVSAFCLLACFAKPVLLFDSVLCYVNKMIFKIQLLNRLKKIL